MQEDNCCQKEKKNILLSNRGIFLGWVLCLLMRVGIRVEDLSQVKLGVEINLKSESVRLGRKPRFICRRRPELRPGLE